MKNIRIRNFFIQLTIFSLFLMTISVNPIQTTYSQEVSNEQLSSTNKPKPATSPTPDDVKKDDERKDNRVIIETISEVIEDDTCIECINPDIPKNGFPVYALFALGGGAFIPFFVKKTEPPPSGPTGVVSQSAP